MTSGTANGIDPQSHNNFDLVRTVLALMVLLSHSATLSAAPEIADLSREPDSTFQLYGEEARQPGSYAYKDLEPRGLHPAMDHHLGSDHDSSGPHDLSCMPSRTGNMHERSATPSR